MFYQITDYSNLIIAFNKAQRASKNKSEKAYYFANQDEILLKIKNELEFGNYYPKPYRTFYVFEPKKRKISAPNFRDRIVHHAINNIIEPIFEKTMHISSFACRKNRGTHKAINLAQYYLKKYQYVLKGDISQYFPSIDHAILFNKIKNKIYDSKTIDLIWRIINSYHSEKGEGKGLPIGNLTSQLFANIYLTDLDYFIDYIAGKNHHIRYLDDWLVFAQTKESLNIVKTKIQKYLKEKLKLEWKSKKTILTPTIRGMTFLGFVIKRNKRKIKRESFITSIRNLKTMKKQVIMGIKTPQQFQQSWASWFGYAIHCHNPNIILSIKNELSNY